MFTYIVITRAGVESTFVSSRALSERLSSGELDEQFVVFTNAAGDETVLPADDIACIYCIPQEKE